MIVANIGRVNELHWELKIEEIDRTMIIYIESLLRVMYIANASDGNDARPWQCPSDARQHYAKASGVLRSTVGNECYDHYIETGDFDWSKIQTRSVTNQSERMRKVGKETKEFVDKIEQAHKDAANSTLMFGPNSASKRRS